MIENAESISLRDKPSEPTDIQRVMPETTNTMPYNLQGQRVGDNYRGIVIINGRKVVK